MEKAERYRRSIERYWSSLQAKIRFLSVFLSETEGSSEMILAIVSGDLASMLSELSVLGRGEALHEVKRLLEMIQAEQSTSGDGPLEMRLRFLRLLSDASIRAHDAVDWHYEAQEAASDYLHILRYAAQSLEMISFYPGKVAECFNDYLQQARDILRPAEIQVPLGGMVVKNCDAEDTYLESEPAFLMRFEKRCRTMGLKLSPYELETIEDAIHSRFGRGDLMDSRFISWLFARVVRHQAERLAEDAGSPREITSTDIAAAWPDY